MHGSFLLVIAQSACESSEHRVESMTRQTKLVSEGGKKNLYKHVFSIIVACSSQPPSETWTAKHVLAASVFEVTGKFVQIQGQMSNVIEFHLHVGKAQVQGLLQPGD